MSECYKIELYVPETHTKQVKDAVFKAGAGKIGSYDCCCWQTEGTGQFRPLDGSNPFIGEKDRIEKVKEIKIELICEKAMIEKVISALRESHPYETPAFQYWEVNV